EAMYRALKRKPKFHRFRLHDLRHIYAINYLREGGNLYALQKQLGHGSIRQTEEYLQFLTPEEQEKVKAGSAQNPAQVHRFPVAEGEKNGWSRGFSIARTGGGVVYRTGLEILCTD